MSFLNKIFKKNAREKTEGNKPDASPSGEEKKPAAKDPEKRFVATGALMKPHTTEKSSREQGMRNAYTFVVDTRANKTMVKRAVEKKYGVRVAAVQMINLPGKERKRGQQVGWKPGFKKAMVAVKEGGTIELP